MSIDELKGMMEACLAKSPEQVKDDLPAIFKKLDEVGIGNLIAKYPDLLPNVFTKLLRPLTRLSRRMCRQRRRWRKSAK